MNGLLLALLVAPFIGGCGLFGAEEEEVERCETCFVSAYINDHSWQSQDVKGGQLPVLSGDERTLFDFCGVAREDVYREHLCIAWLEDNAPTGNKNIAFIQEDGYSHGGRFDELDWDVIISSYDATADSTANILNVESWDEERRIAEGSFEMLLTYKGTQDPLYGPSMRRYPDTLRITDGRFRVEMEDRRPPESE